MEIQTLSEQINNLDSKVWAAIIAALATLVVAVLNFINQKKTLQIQTAAFLSATKEKKIQSLQNQLEGFYLPFNRYLTATTELYKHIREGLPKEFRTLVYLVDKEAQFKDSAGVPQKVTLADEKLKMIDRIITIQEKLQTLIIEKSFLVDNEVLTKDFTKDKRITSVKLFFDKEAPSSIPEKIGLLDFFNTHMDYIKMAKAGELRKADMATIELYVFPREINKIIQERIAEIEIKIKEIK
ncbi:MAG: hypothetical protein WCI92_07270 [Bacteroidota bacterium]